jgi:hypothetical protein
MGLTLRADIFPTGDAVDVDIATQWAAIRVLDLIGIIRYIVIRLYN